jgi:transcriptional regulator with PAS, ATPase and Fis domain
MAAQLVAIDGPLKGQVCPLFEAQLSIGRSVVNRLPITNDPFVSREHCVIRESEGEFILEDLDSQNGTFVNGLPVRRRTLQHSDQVQAGGSVFLFLVAGEAEMLPSFDPGDETPLLGTQVQRPAEMPSKTTPRRGIQHDMIGESQPMQRVYDVIAKVAPADTTVLILGESGTGKELAARAVHANSPRSARPFVAINCAALTESLLESELFGHERGAFTGAVAQKIGRIERAEGGTFFLDEIGELRPDLQAKLLRVLQERAFERIGGTRSIPLNIRIVAATNRDLGAAMERSGFRRDLYYRLNSVSLRMPALRERREDIPLLAAYFVTRIREKMNRRIAGVSREARALLMSYDWPGNVRELENAIEHAAVLGSSERILAEDLPESILECEPPTQAIIAQYHEGMKAAKKQLILKAFEEAGGDFNEAAQRLGLQRTYLHRLVRNLNLRDATRAIHPQQPGRQSA